MYEISSSWEYSGDALHESEKIRNRIISVLWKYYLPVSLVLKMNEWICFKKGSVFY